MKYDLNLTWNKLKENPEALEIVKEYLPGMEIMVNHNPNAARVSIGSAMRYAPDLFPEDKVNDLKEKLAIYSANLGLTDEEKEKVASYKDLAKKRLEKSASSTKKSDIRRDAIYPGKPWLDTNGNRIQAHAGALIYDDGAYYWYGENKEYTTGKNKIWTWGIRAYRSTDLYNWDDMGLIVEPDLDNPDANLFPEKCVDRPHIIKCKKTNKYVMWIKISGAESCFTILEADKLLGPYKLVKEDYYPLDTRVGDFDIYVDEETDVAYMFMDADHKRIAGYVLSEDYLSVDREISSQYEGLHAPFHREGVTLFTRDNKKYLITSGVSGYTPNQSDSAMTDSWESVFETVGDPHVEDESMASFNSQISQVFRVNGTDLYIAIADRWMPKHLLDGKSADAVRRAIACKYEPDKYQATEEEKAMFAARPDLERADTSIADYVWLPVIFDNQKPKIKWFDSWKIEDLL